MQQPYSDAYSNEYTDEVVIPQEVEDEELHTIQGGFSGIAKDDIILLAVILLLLTDSKSDKATLIILAILFLSGTDFLR